MPIQGTTLRKINLQEHKPSEPLQLSDSEREALRSAIPNLSIQRELDGAPIYTLNPRSTVGAVEVGDLSVLIEPKIGIPQLLSMACYTIGKFKLRPESFKFPSDHALPDVLALALASAAQRAFSRGLLHGYRVEEETLNTIRGRIRFNDQIRRRFGSYVPIEVTYDEFTDDILTNRLVKAAVYRLAYMRLRRPETRASLGRIGSVLENVSLETFRPDNVPTMVFDRLNSHYREVVALSTLVLQRVAYEAKRGQVRVSGFTMNMDRVFQEFVTVALREALGISSARTFGERNIPTLDHPEDGRGRVSLRPDLTWWEGTSCVFAGDAKYKNLTGSAVPNGDLYQLLAYVTALNVPGGLLVYAEGEAEDAVHLVRHTAQRLEVASLSLAGTLDDVLERVVGLAKRVSKLRK